MITCKDLLSPDELKQKYPLTHELSKRKRQFNIDIKNAIKGERFLVIVGPCSADNMQAVLEYAERLYKLSQQVSGKILIVLRVYTAKPRTDGEGYLGALFHNVDNEPIDIEQGLHTCRQMMIDCLKIGLPIADELLYPDSLDYYGDLISYLSLGARSSMDALHRALASGVDVAVGVKNSIDGDLLAMAKGVYAVSRPKTFIHNHKQITTNGNKYAHGILRGYHDGEKFNNNINQAEKVKQYYHQLGITNDFVLVDCSHANSGKVANNQIDNALLAVNNKDVGGIMLESYLYSGCSANSYGVSKTDDCLDFDSTEKLILQLYQILNERTK